MDVTRYVAAVVIAYLLGAIPSGLIVGRLVKGVDLREFGSGKTGATNALRTLGPLPAALVMFGDLLKGVLAVFIAYQLTHSLAGESLAGIAAVVGHNWPIYAGFRGGRGVVVSLGVFWILCWPAALICSVIGMPIIALSRFVSLGVLVGASVGLAATIPFVVIWHYSPWILVYAALSAGMIFARHRDNIERLLAGTERKLGQPAQPVA